MPDVPNGGAITNRDLMEFIKELRAEFSDAIERVRTETRESRHAHANKVQEAIGALELRMDARLRSIEIDIAASAPSTLGPRINSLETWRAEMRGAFRGWQIVTTVAAFIAVVGTIINWFKP